MIKQVPGKIYLSDQRGLTQTKQFNRYSTFSFEAYVHADKMPFGRLYVCNDETIAPAQQISFVVEEASHIIIIPITGDVTCNNGSGDSQRVEVEQICMFTMPTQSTFQIANPYQQEAISLLQIWLKADDPVKKHASQSFSFKFQCIENKLLEILPGNNSSIAVNQLPFSLSLGSFAGRKDTTYVLNGRDTAFFAFVIEGAFEVEGRLLHAGDAITLWNVTEIELEALSTQALILTMEIQQVRPNDFS
jgi:quercetin 2,3-dioxygenase